MSDTPQPPQHHRAPKLPRKAGTIIKAVVTFAQQLQAGGVAMIVILSWCEAALTGLRYGLEKAVTVSTAGLDTDTDEE